MPRRTALTAATAFIVASGALAGDQAPAAHPPKTAKKMRMDEPMTSKMMKDGMMKGDVQKSASQKDAAMKPMVDREEKTMPQGAPKP